jgi:hypothetical protein
LAYRRMPVQIIDFDTLKNSEIFYTFCFRVNVESVSRRFGTGILHTICPSRLRYFYFEDDETVSLKHPPSLLSQGFSTKQKSRQNLHKFRRDALKSNKKTKLHGLSPRANYTDRATASCRRSDCQLFGWRVPHGQRDGSLLSYSRFSRQEPLLFYQVAPQLYSRG